MRVAWRWNRVSIVGRTYLLMLAALVVAGGIGLALPLNRSANTEVAVSLSEIAWRLGASDSRFGHERPPPYFEHDAGSHDPFDGQPPPSNRGNFYRMPPPGRPGPRASADVTVKSLSTQPEVPKDAALQPSEPLRAALAGLLRVDSAAVLIYAAGSSENAGNDGSPEGALLSGSFLAALRLPDGHWRSVERTVQRFPTSIQRQALVMFVAALALLLPLAWLFARALSAPILRFSAAAGRLGLDPTAPLLPREGPPEMLRAVDSFNAMQGRINRLIQERTHMVGAIAHDLRTPLTRLAFRLDDLPPPLSDKVNADINEMKMMISAALDFIRDRALSGQHERLDFRLLVERVVDDQADLGHDVTLEAGVPFTVEGTPLALRRMVVNLVDNALKYGDRARLRLRAVSGRCVLEIDDDGPGIPEQLQQQVFEPFFRIEASRNRDTGGIGLGLAAVRGIVLDHGGDITVGNRKGGGLRVTIALRMARS